MSVHAKRLEDKVLVDHPSLHFLSVAYCSAVAIVIEDDDSSLSLADVTIDVANVLWRMTPNPRLNIMRKLLVTTSCQNKSGLNEELTSGQCVLSLQADGTCERTVFLVVLKVKFTDGKTLVQIARRFDGKLKPNVTFPGERLAEGDGDESTVEKLIEKDFHRLKDGLLFKGKTQEIQSSHSTYYNVGSRYLKIVHSFHIIGSILELPWIGQFNELALPCSKSSSNSAKPSSGRRNGRSSTTSTWSTTIRPVKSTFSSVAPMTLNHHGPSMSSLSLDSRSNGNLQSFENVYAFHTLDEDQQVDKIFAWLDEDVLEKVMAPAYAEELASWLNEFRPDEWCLPPVFETESSRKSSRDENSKPIFETEASRDELLS
jgi:hypothetical protein